MFEDQHRIIIAHGRLEDPLGVVSIGNGHDLDAGNSDEIALHALCMLCAAAGGADRSAHHERYSDRAAGHVPQLGRVIDDLVHGQEEEIAVLDVGDRPHAHDRGPDGRAEEAQLGDRRIQHPLGKLLFQAQGDGERASPAARNGDVFPQAEDRRITPHLLGDRLAERLRDTEPPGGG